MGSLARTRHWGSLVVEALSAMPQLPHSWLFFLLLATQVLSQNSCCPERTVLGSDGSSGVYQLSSDSDTRCGDGCLYSKQDSADSAICFQPSSSGSVTSGGPSPSASCPTSTTIEAGHLVSEPGPTVALASTLAPTSAVNQGNNNNNNNNTVTVAILSTTTGTTTTTTTSLDLSIWSIQTTINPKSISMAGTWGPDEFCPFGSYATGIELKVAPLCTRRCRTDDDFAVGATRLTCAHYLAPDTPVGTVTSTESTAGRSGGGNSLGYSWFALQSCPSSTWITSSRYLSEVFITDNGGAGGTTVACPDGIICNGGGSTAAGNDPVGGVNMDARCSDGTELLGNSGISAGDKAGYYSLSEWEECPTGSAVCGIRTRVQEGETDAVSNLGQTEIVLHCCQIP